MGGSRCLLLRVGGSGVKIDRSDGLDIVASSKGNIEARSEPDTEVSPHFLLANQSLAT
ncbi:hypothetical protein XCCB100_0070 [Xanthomonas campestris pv. campestris]|uniref:Uncharacterized protein n=1 Tax=Xanthomonas campestris pv. campestris (strain B100) TaxID=509169 RepID=B0RLN1_XANCB|nr:hypothetical protein XCCB100_0070 [Xanthomonas campestris pv. campestris]